MPTTRRKRERHQQARVTPEVLQAVEEEQAGTRDPQAYSTRHLLGIRPWEWGSGPLCIPEDAYPDLCADLEAAGVPWEIEDAD